MLSRFPLHQKQYQQTRLLSKLANISKLTSTARFCSAVSTTSASSPSIEMNEFLSFLTRRGSCTASNATRRSAASSAARSATLAANNQQTSKTDQTAQDESELENPTNNNNANENNFSNVRNMENAGTNKTGTKVFCSNCNRKFSSVASLQQHVNARHERPRKSSKASVKKNNTASPEVVSNIAEQWQRLVVQQPVKKSNVNVAKKQQQEKQQTESIASVSSTNIHSSKVESTKEESKTAISRPEQSPIHVVAADLPKKVVVDHSSSVEISNTNIRKDEETVGVSGGITLTDQDRCDLLRAQLELVEATTEAVISWSQRWEKRKIARSQENNSILLPVATGNEMMMLNQQQQQQQNLTSSNSTSSLHSPFFISKKQPFGNSESISLISRKHLVHKQKQQSPTLTPATMNVCDVGGLSSSSLIGVVTSVKTGTMKSLTAPQYENNSDTNNNKQENISSSAPDNSKNNAKSNVVSPPVSGQVKAVKPQRATILEVSCRNFQADKVSGRVSMTKNNIAVRIREKSQRKKDIVVPAVVDENDNKALQEESKSTSPRSSFNVGDVLFCQGQLQLHTLFDLATKKWVCNGLVVDICMNSRNGQVVKILERQMKEESEMKEASD